MTRVLTGCGIVDLENLSAARFDLDRVAAWLARKLRFNGHLARPVSVAEHSLVVAGLVPPRLRLAALLHDAHEYVLGDVLRPVEAAVCATEWPRMRLRSLRADVDWMMSLAALGPDAPLGAPARLVLQMTAPEVRAADDAACAFERKFCAAPLTDWPEQALYAREPSPAAEVARIWINAVRLEARLLLDGGPSAGDMGDAP